MISWIAQRKNIAVVFWLRLLRIAIPDFWISSRYMNISYNEVYTKCTLFSISYTCLGIVYTRGGFWLREVYTLCTLFPKIPRSRPRRLTDCVVWKRHTVSWYVQKSVQFGVHLSDRTTFVWITVLSVKFLSNRRKRNAQHVLPVSSKQRQGWIHMSTIRWLNRYG